ncbi:hypothetical protein ACLBSM_32985, partial [Klebsiella pneumoniae]
SYRRVGSATPCVDAVARFATAPSTHAWIYNAAMPATPTLDDLRRYAVARTLFKPTTLLTEYWMFRLFVSYR